MTPVLINVYLTFNMRQTLYKRQITIFLLIQNDYITNIIYISISKNIVVCVIDLNNTVSYWKRHIVLME